MRKIASKTRLLFSAFLITLPLNWLRAAMSKKFILRIIVAHVEAASLYSINSFQNRGSENVPKWTDERYLRKVFPRKNYRMDQIYL